MGLPTQGNNSLPTVKQLEGGATNLASVGR
jgi:hypothetical protein